ncbi:outer membrane lipoprotein LolB [Aestuariicella hydrocarbonica]|uniref:Outer-membrane lipoprotein LolB n=1 Tax=Pseudomaricurvus hydrocarbonicus TaxID=1470433 RepID=A0A9E5JUW2_9GAMM|nr:lipoprotein insertase outer membrane protein LolB [Aestuariicella hydrocarbonica]NHO65010.1 outer membrane lipoprotein LolB [Aestuariicella hydrocarbonica]
MTQTPTRFFAYCLSSVPAIRLPSAATILLLLTACAGQQMPDSAQQTPPLPAAPSALTQWDDYRTVLGNIAHWQVQGKLGIRVPDHSGSVYFNWKQLPEQFAILLNGPLGQGSTWVRGTDNQVSLEQAGQEARFAATAEQLMYNTLGWWLPVSELNYWVKGIPAPNQPVNQSIHYEDGTLQTLQQNGWDISYPRYQQIDGWQLPGKVVARHRLADQDSDIKLTFIINQWQLH